MGRVRTAIIGMVFEIMKEVCSDCCTCLGEAKAERHLKGYGSELTEGQRLKRTWLKFPNGGWEDSQA